MQLKLNEQKKIGEKAPAPLSHGKVLVVDDVESNLHVAMGLLNLYSLKIETATSGREAIDKVRTVMDATTPAKSELYDIIFMDHMMPKMDGIEAVKLIRDMGYTSPIVALTANATAGHENMFFRNGFDDFIAKPIDLRLLDMTLNKFIHSLQSGGSGESLQSEVEEVAAVKNTESTEVTARRPRVNPNVSTLPRSLLLECFINDARNSLEMLEGFTESPDFDGFAGEDNSAKGDLRDYITCVHGIKSALYNIGETDLSELAYDLESSGRKGDSATIVATTPTLIWELKAVVLKAEAELKSGDSRKSKGTLGDEDFRERLAQVKQACDNYSRKLALNLIAEIEAYTLDSPASEVLEKIKNYVLNTDFEEAATEIQKYMGEES
jgi:CheY-like chemotaxis protein